jgi:hypothetical protein
MALLAAFSVRYGTSISTMVVMVSIIADWIRYEHASCREDGNSGDE